MKVAAFYSIVFCLVLVGCTRQALPVDTSFSSQFSSEEQKRISDSGPDDPMRLFLTTRGSDSLVLRKKSMTVSPTADPTLDKLIGRLFATVRDSLSLGVGIAAPQVGVLKRVIWVQRFDKEGFPFEVYLNPVIRQYSTKKQECMEGCLSIPDKRAMTKNRSYAILLEYDTREGEHVIEMVEDFTAVIFQHEIDHLDGVLFIDHLE